MESDGNQLAYCDLIFNTIYKSPVRHKYRFYANQCKRQKIVTVSMRNVYIPNIDIKVWTRKIEFPQGNFQLSLPQPEITRQRHFELTDI